MAKEDNNCILQDNNIGQIKLADDVIAVIAGMAATEVEGVDSMAGNITNEVVSKLGMKNLSKGVKVDIEDHDVSIVLTLNLKFGCNVKTVSAKVQEKVKTMVENMTGLNVTGVCVNVVGVAIEK